MRPIGVFDSGVGGLTVVRALKRQLPQVPILYLGDTARLPYGTKSPATVVRYSERNIAFLLDNDVRAIVVACNTASALALPKLSLRVPAWGVIRPGAAYAAARAKRHIGVIGTEATIASTAYEEAISRLRPELKVSSLPCPLFVPLVEEGWQNDPIAEQVARRYLEPLLATDIDTLLLGCTHYPLLGSVLAKVAGEAVTLVDSAEATAACVASALDLDRAEEEQDMHADRYFVTDAGERFQRIAREILGDEPIHLDLVDIA